MEGHEGNTYNKNMTSCEKNLQANRNNIKEYKEGNKSNENKSLKNNTHKTDVLGKKVFYDKHLCHLAMESERNLRALTKDENVATKIEIT